MNHQKVNIDELILKVREELKNAQYADSFIESKFAPIWAKLKEFMQLRGTMLYDAAVGLDFLEDVYGLTVFKKLPQHLAICVRAVNVLTDYKQHGIILAKARRKVHSYHPEFQELFQGYIDHCKSEGRSLDTLMLDSKVDTTN